MKRCPVYIRDDFASVTRPIKELKGFKRINLMPGETKQVKFEITPDMLLSWILNLEPVVEPGKFTVYRGSNSANLFQHPLRLLNDLLEKKNRFYVIKKGRYRRKFKESGF